MISDNDRLGNKVAQEGCDLCHCGCKYWENDRCVDCGAPVSEKMTEQEILDRTRDLTSLAARTPQEPAAPANGYQGTLTDLTAPAVVEVEIRQDGKVVWVSVDGVTVFRACRIDQLVVTDNRPYAEREPAADYAERVLLAERDLEGR